MWMSSENDYNTMSVMEATVRWLRNEDLRVATLLGFITIPVTLALSWNTLPYGYSATPVLFAGFLGGLYYSNRTRSASPTQAGVRIGVISAFDSFIGAATVITSGWALSVGSTAIAAVFGVLWFFFSVIVLCLISVVGARVGGFVGRLAPFRRGESQSA
jgi:hypothetical protein